MGFLSDLLSSLLQGPPGPTSPTIGGSISVPLGSGYSSGVDVAARVTLLTRVQTEAINMFPPVGGSTFCNKGLIYVANALDCQEFNSMNATCIVRRALTLCISSPKEWRQDSWDRAVAHALRGGFAFFGMEAPLGELHGHVATVAAQQKQMSSTWKETVPVLANVGKANAQGFNRLSKCFTLAEKPMLKCFLWKS